MNEYAGYCSAFNPDASETVAYNNPLFPAYARYGVLSRYPDYAAISHWHEDLEFILVKKGQMTYSINGELVELSKNNGIMVNSRQIHHGFSAEHRECEFICILLSPELLWGSEWFYQNCVGHITERSVYPYVYLDSAGWQAEVLRRLDEIYRSFGDGADGMPAEGLAYFELLENFIAIMKLLYRKLPAGMPEKESTELVSLKSMIAYIEKHFTEHVSLVDVASAGACCKSRCDLLFKKYLREMPVSYMTKLRLRKSLAALLETDACITDIAYAHGFGGASYYCETFRKYYGVSPLKYKKMHRNAERI